MRKLIGYIPATLFTAVYLFAWFSGNGLTLSMVLIWLACFWLSAFVLHKGLCWGGIFGMIPGVQMIYIWAHRKQDKLSILKCRLALC